MMGMESASINLGVNRIILSHMRSIFVEERDREREREKKEGSAERFYFFRSWGSDRRMANDGRFSWDRRADTRAGISHPSIYPWVLVIPPFLDI
jgi:hypothetical protein